MIENNPTPARPKPAKWTRRPAMPPCKAPSIYATGTGPILPGMETSELVTALDQLDRAMARGLVKFAEPEPIEEGEINRAHKAASVPSQAAIYKRRQRARQRERKAASVDSEAIEGAPTPPKESLTG